MRDRRGLVSFMVFNVTFNNISVISWRSVLLVEETGVPGEKHWPAASHWQTLSYNVVHFALRGIFRNFWINQKLKMVTTSEINSYIGRYGKKTEMFFFSTEATNFIKLKLYMHKYWMSLYKIMFFMWVDYRTGTISHWL
jgi:hypothetical protein